MQSFRDPGWCQLRHLHPMVSKVILGIDTQLEEWWGPGRGGDFHWPSLEMGVITFSHRTLATAPSLQQKPRNIVQSCAQEARQQAQF